MRIKDILREKGTDVFTFEAGKTVHDAICKLNEHSIGALVVTEEGGEIRGIITERDILKECGERCVRLSEPRTPGEAACPCIVEDVMTKDLIVGGLEDDLADAMRLMTKNRVRHLPILDGGKMAGIISIGDVVNAHLNEIEDENRSLHDYVHGVVR